jgi:DNA-dependent RNA polymerase auxiliary subunit epsilon
VRTCNYIDEKPGEIADEIPIRERTSAKTLKMSQHDSSNNQMKTKIDESILNNETKTKIDESSLNNETKTKTDEQRENENSART